MVITRTNPFRAERVSPFITLDCAHASEDTLSCEADVKTVFPPDAGWNVVALSNLRDVEDLLDSLEARCVADRELHALGNSKFAVRWR